MIIDAEDLPAGSGGEIGGETGGETGGSSEVIIDAEDLPAGSSGLDDVPKTGEADISWLFYMSLMLVSLIALAFLLPRRKESI